MASATKSKSSSSKKSSSSSGGTAARSATKAAKVKDIQSPTIKRFVDLREKRAAYDLPVVDAPGPLLHVEETIASQDGKDSVEIGTGDGGSVEVSVGGKSVVLDREGVAAMQRVFRKVGLAL